MCMDFCVLQNSVLSLMMEIPEADGSNKRVLVSPAVPCPGREYPNKRRLVIPAASEQVSCISPMPSSSLKILEYFYQCEEKLSVMLCCKLGTQLHLHERNGDYGIAGHHDRGNLLAHGDIGPMVFSVCYCLFAGIC